MLGVHSAKFENEKQSAQIREAILRYGVHHPVVNDDDLTIWRRLPAVERWPRWCSSIGEGRIVAKITSEQGYASIDPILTKAIPYFAGKSRLHRSPASWPLEALAGQTPCSRNTARHRLIVSHSNHNGIRLRTIPENFSRPSEQALSAGQVGLLRSGGIRQSSGKSPAIGSILPIPGITRYALPTSHSGKSPRFWGPASKRSANSQTAGPAIARTAVGCRDRLETGSTPRWRGLRWRSRISRCSRVRSEGLTNGSPLKASLHSPIDGGRT